MLNFTKQIVVTGLLLTSALCGYALPASEQIGLTRPDGKSLGNLILQPHVGTTGFATYYQVWDRAGSKSGSVTCNSDWHQCAQALNNANSQIIKMGVNYTSCHVGIVGVLCRKGSNPKYSGYYYWTYNSHTQTIHRQWYAWLY